MNRLLTTILIVLVAVTLVTAANPGHTAGSISPGTFNTGGAFTFPEQLNVQGNFIIDTNALFVNATSGNVGIGTTNPTSRLFVEGSITVNATSDVCIEGGVCLSEAGSGSIDGTGTNNTIPLWTGSATLGNSFLTQTASTVSIGADLVVPSSNFIINTDAFFVDASLGRVGIGTNNPQAALDVRGEIATNNNNVTGVQCITFASGGEICST